MKHLRCQAILFTMIVVAWISVINCTSNLHAEDISTSISGRVINEYKEPVPDIHIAIKPVLFGEHIDLKQRTHFLIWPKVVTDKDGKFSFTNIEVIMKSEGGKDQKIRGRIEFKNGQPLVNKSVQTNIYQT